MDISDLRVFEAVARLRNMNRAAEELNTVQSNVTARIRGLESEFGVRLFERHSRGVELTSAGARLVPFATKALRLQADARKAILDEGDPAGPLDVGSLETTLAIRLSDRLAEFAAFYPKVDLTIRTGTTPELIRMVLDHRIEGAFVCGPVHHRELNTITMFREELVLVSPQWLETADHVLSSPEVTQIVLRQGCSYRQRLDDIFARRGVVGSRALEFGTLEAIFASVAAGVGVTLMPRGLVELCGDRHAIREHRLPPAESDVMTTFVRRADGYVSTAHSAFLDHVRSAKASRAAEESLAGESLIPLAQQG